MSVRLTDKEIQALSKKKAQKENDIIASNKKKAAKEKQKDAKAILSALDSIPDNVHSFMFNNRYKKGFVDIETISELLVNNSDFETVDNNAYESDVILFAHDAKSMSELCSKLGI